MVFPKSASAATLSARRSEVVISTKLGYGVNGMADWTGPCITAGIEQALRLLRTDHIDIAHFHSCPRQVLEQTDVIDALECGQTRRQSARHGLLGRERRSRLGGGLRAVRRLHGLAEHLRPAHSHTHQLPAMTGKGFIAKRAVANHPWRFAQRPVGDYCEEYWARWQAMGLDNRGLEWGEISLRFALSFPHVSAAIVGTANVQHLLQSLQWVAKGPLPADWVTELHTAFAQHDNDWTGQI
jgi:aryl-alcohol dehydrogenase-like predicted oxidoreductase